MERNHPRWIEYNPNPYDRRTIDCTVRALSMALGLDWDTVYLMICAVGFAEKSMPSDNDVWGEVLRRNGFRKYVLDNTCPGCYTAEEFCAKHRRGMYVLGFDTHVCVAVDGRIYDAWDSQNEVPKYIWTRERII